MTRAEAKALARARWGSNGWAWESTVGTVGVNVRGLFKVGRWEAAGPRAFGTGSSYEAAFIDADARLARDAGELQQ